MSRTLKELKRSYGFEDVAIAPGGLTLNPEMVDVSMRIDGMSLRIPVIASAMDAVVDSAFAIAMSRAGGLAVMNLDGIQTRYDDPRPLFIEIAEAPRDAATELLQKIYSQPVKENLIGKRVEEIKRGGGTAAVSCIPANTKKFAPAAVEAGADLLVVQSTVTTARHASKSVKGLIFHELVSQIKVPVLVGNTVNYDVTLELMEEGVHGVLVGVGPGAACTSREVLGVGVPQVSATLECAAAREEYFKTTGRYVPIITDGGIRTGGDVCKSFASGADAVMIGTPLAQATEAPGRGFNWGMATPHASLPRGTRIQVGTRCSLEKILFGPSHRTDGTENLVGALQISMGMVGAKDIREMHRAELIYAPAIKTEGKIFQMQGLGSK
ncbi:MAG: GuaB3 family IMP dehydrogenase-related protein [Dehalococcoidia bacterium]|nr:GuaB3 family IMP dehydrogenase-related protein [Dehalococcoidia bacterium]